jgi:cytidylate kinase
MSPYIVAIDGPAGSGKSSVSKEVARRLGFGYLDTGAAYRALAWASLSDPKLALDRLASAELAKDFDYSISVNPSDYWVRVGGTDVTGAIREGKIAESVSKVAGIASVRAFMKLKTLQLVEQAPYEAVVVEGRDITTVVAPDAKVRILLTAREAVRLERRSAELSGANTATVERQVLERDASDSKVVDFMTPAPGVQLVDSSDLNFEQTVQAVIDLIEQGSSKDSND